jgi:hypothetical protein
MLHQQYLPFQLVTTSTANDVTTAKYSINKSRAAQAHNRGDGTIPSYTVSITSQ